MTQLQSSFEAISKISARIIAWTPQLAVHTLAVALAPAAAAAAESKVQAETPLLQAAQLDPAVSLLAGQILNTMYLTKCI